MENNIHNKFSTSLSCLLTPNPEFFLLHRHHNSCFLEAYKNFGNMNKSEQIRNPR